MWKDVFMQISALSNVDNQPEQFVLMYLSWQEQV